MNLSIRPAKVNKYPLKGLLLKGDQISWWLEEIQRMQLDLDASQVHPLPGLRPNSIWGSLILSEKIGTITDPGRHLLCQAVNSRLWIPAYSVLHPQLNEEELERLFAKGRHLFHPEIGYVLLEEAIDWKTLISNPVEHAIEIIKPVAPVNIPQEIQGMELQAQAMDEVIEELENLIRQPSDKKISEPLNPGEKIKLGLLRTLFRNEGEEGEMVQGTYRELLGRLKGNLNLNSQDSLEHLKKEFEDLEARNQKELDKLFNLFKKNPDEALKYALPLDQEGTARGNQFGSYRMGLLWQTLGLFSQMTSSGSSGSTALFNGDQFMKLRAQYLETAKQYVKEKKYEKAAFIYFQLLKDKLAAAKVLEEGELYEKAAAIYLKYLNNKKKAAECYEKGQLISKAIDLYEELEEHEKVGDLYMQIKQRKKGMAAYQKVLDAELAKFAFYKAFSLLKNKMDDIPQGLEVLRRGWLENRDPYRCLCYFYDEHPESTELQRAIDFIYHNEIKFHQQSTFLDSLKKIYQSKPELHDFTQEMAYEIIAKQLPKDPMILYKLKYFTTDGMVKRDVMRFKQ